MSQHGMEEMAAAIAWYSERGLDWSSVVTFIGIKDHFGGWREMVDALNPRRPQRPRKPFEPAGVLEVPANTCSVIDFPGGHPSE